MGNPSEMTWLVLIFAGTALLGLWMVRREMSEELLPDPRGIDPEPSRPAFGWFTGLLASLLPTLDDRALQKRLWKAGYYRPSAVADFRALRNVLTLVPLVAGAMTALLFDSLQPMQWSLIAGGIVGLLGFSLPRVVIDSQGRAREGEFQSGLPLLLDSIGMCMAAGESVTGALRRVAHQLAKTHPVLSEELAITARHAELTSLSGALRCLAERVQVPEMTVLAHTLQQSQDLGNDVAKGLFEVSTALRVSLRQNMEAAANRTTFWMILPTTTCLMVAAGLMLIGPGLLEASRESKKAFEAINETQSLIDQANEQFKPFVQMGPVGIPPAPQPQPAPNR